MAQPDEPGRVIYQRAANGNRRRPISVRLAGPGRDLIRERADAECRGVESEWVRRALRYAAQNMPKGWQG